MLVNVDFERKGKVRSQIKLQRVLCGLIYCCKQNINDQYSPCTKFGLCKLHYSGGNGVYIYIVHIDWVQIWQYYTKCLSMLVADYIKDLFGK